MHRSIRLGQSRNSSLVTNDSSSHNEVGLDGSYASLRSPWVSSVADECNYQVCSGCRPAYAERAFLSLDAVARGEILPTAAVGYGFHVLGERPVVNAEILMNIGSRSVSQSSTSESAGAASDHPILAMPASSTAPQDISLESQVNPMEPPETEVAHEPDRWPRASIELQEQSRPSRSATRRASQGQLKHSPACENLAAYAEYQGDEPQAGIPERSCTPPRSPPHLREFQAATYLPPGDRLPELRSWTPPGSPSPLMVTFLYKPIREPRKPSVPNKNEK